jgi:type I restriction enzyme R subunit
VRSGEPLTAADIDELQRILVAAGIGNDDTFEQASRKAGSFGLFIRSLVGLDRAAAKAGLRRLPRRQALLQEPDQVRHLIIDELTERRDRRRGARVYEAPYIGLAPDRPRRHLHRTRRPPDPSSWSVNSAGSCSR